MAEANENKKQQGAGKRKLPLKTVLVVLAVLFAEVSTVAVAYIVFGGPSEAKANHEQMEQAAQAEKPVELLVLQDRFQNTRSGRSYLYDTEIHIVVANKHKPEMQDKIESMKAQLATDVATVFRRAEPAHLHEPELATLTRQVEAQLNKHFGHDADGEPYVQDVLMRTMEFRADL